MSQMKQSIVRRTKREIENERRQLLDTVNTLNTRLKELDREESAAKATKTDKKLQTAVVKFIDRNIVAKIGRVCDAVHNTLEDLRYATEDFRYANNGKSDTEDFDRLLEQLDTICGTVSDYIQDLKDGTRVAVSTRASAAQCFDLLTNTENGSLDNAEDLFRLVEQGLIMDIEEAQATLNSYKKVKRSFNKAYRNFGALINLSKKY